jgi:hypothetical protein
MIRAEGCIIAVLSSLLLWGDHLDNKGAIAMSQHAACSPSSAAMWLACPASVTRPGHHRPSSKYAREGTRRTWSPR